MMRFTIEAAALGKWQVTNVVTGEPYGDPHDSPDQATALVRGAEAHFLMDRLTACPRGVPGCS